MHMRPFAHYGPIQKVLHIAQNDGATSPPNLCRATAKSLSLHIRRRTPDRTVDDVVIHVGLRAWDYDLEVGTVVEAPSTYTPGWWGIIADGATRPKLMNGERLIVRNPHTGEHARPLPWTRTQADYSASELRDVCRVCDNAAPLLRGAVTHRARMDTRSPAVTQLSPSAPVCPGASAVG